MTLRVNDENRLRELREMLAQDPDHVDADAMREELSLLELKEAQAQGFNTAREYELAQEVMLHKKRIVTLFGATTFAVVLSLLTFVTSLMNNAQVTRNFQLVIQATDALSRQGVEHARALKDLQKFEDDTLDYMSDLDAQIAAIEE